MRSARLLGAVTLALATGALGGCVAAAIPIAAAGMMARGQLGDPRDSRQPEVAKATSVSGLEMPQSARVTVLTGLTELPPPSPSADARRRDEIASFSVYALQQAARDPAVSARESAILEEPTRFVPTRRKCGDRPPAILVDLDPGRGTFDPLADITPPAGLGPALLSLREQGVAIAWQSRLGMNFQAVVREALGATRLDSQGEDTLLLARSVEERKQTLRDEFAETYCIVAMLGDERADFDELYLYLKDPDGALQLESMIGQGWFLTENLLVEDKDAA